MIDQPRRRRSKPRSSPYVLDRINPDAAGIDCGSTAHFVAVPPDRDPVPVQSFRTFTTDQQLFLRLVDEGGELLAGIDRAHDEGIEAGLVGFALTVRFEHGASRGYDVVDACGRTIGHVYDRRMGMAPQ
jgi:hypothetical protein